jgi:hypothetical protein
MLMLLLGVVVFGAAGSASAESVEGTIQGFNCVTIGKTCPVGKEDPVIATERMFVLLKADGTYFFVPNLDRAIMARHIAQPVRITGKLDMKYRTLQAESLEVMTDNAWRLTWSKEMQRDVSGAMGISGF